MSSALLGDYQFHEQYIDAVASCISDQRQAEIEIMTDGDMRFDRDIGGRA